MRVIVQRSKEAKVEIDSRINGQIDKGMVVLVGFKESDNPTVVEKVVDKMVNLRIYSDSQGKMNLSLKDVGGQILSISQFTLYANARHGRRPSFIDAAKPDIAISLYDYFNACIKKHGIEVQTGVFGADMQVSLVNDGPVTIILDSDEL